MYLTYYIPHRHNANRINRKTLSVIFILKTAIIYELTSNDRIIIIRHTMPAISVYLDLAKYTECKKTTRIWTASRVSIEKVSSLTWNLILFPGCASMALKFTLTMSFKVIRYVQWDPIILTKELKEQTILGLHMWVSQLLLSCLVQREWWLRSKQQFRVC